MRKPAVGRRPSDGRADAFSLGVGFLGGGSISVLKSNGHVVGLTTAASIWASAAIGIATGIGHYLLAVGVTLLQILVLRTFERFERQRVYDLTRARARPAEQGATEPRRRWREVRVASIG